ncbi:MAG: TIGR01777 family oxidoreductase [Chloroflexi bacterium]|nr:TIGR01777 family oxidoreductase [Chloroflexota bacterium]
MSDEALKVILAGGSGFIGNLLAKSLIADGATVWVLSRNPLKARLPDGVQGVEWDARTAQGWGSLVKKADVIVNLTGENLGSARWTAERKKRMLASRVNSGLAILEAIQNTPRRPRVLVQASAVGYYGLTGSRIVTEKDGPGNDFLSRICVQWEAATQPAEDLGVRRVVIRSGVVISPEQTALRQMALPIRLFVGGPLGSGAQWFPWIHPKDEVDAIRYLLAHPEANGAYNLAAPEAITNEHFGRILARLLRRPYWLAVPSFALRLLLGEMSVMVLEGQRVIPERLQALGYRFHFETTRAALENLYHRTI